MRIPDLQIKFAGDGIKILLYWLIQCVWGLPQTLLGLALLLLHRRDEHFLFHGAPVTRWQGRSSMSVGPFVFVTKDPFFCEKFSGTYSREELSGRLLVHEYGHTIQSLLLGSMYLIVIGIPSPLWGWLPQLAQKRKVQQISYFSFFTENWANRCGERITGKRSMEQLVID